MLLALNGLRILDRALLLFLATHARSDGFHCFINHQTVSCLINTQTLISFRPLHLHLHESSACCSWQSFRRMSFFSLSSGAL
jgi:hypothetical protein